MPQSEKRLHRSLELRPLPVRLAERFSGVRDIGEGAVIIVVIAPLHLRDPLS